MQQLQFLKKQIKIDSFRVFNVPDNPLNIETIASFQIITCFTIISIIMQLIFNYYWLTVLLMGFILPIICEWHSINIPGQKSFLPNDYWKYLSLLLWFRMIYSYALVLDAIIILFFWHPNFKLSQKIHQQIMNYIKSQPKKKYSPYNR